MKRNNILLLMLAATLSLGACSGHHEYRKNHTTAMSGQHINYTYEGRDLSRADVRTVQTSLAAKGYYKGSIDGIWGKQTSRAILAYQTDHEQIPSGAMSVETLQEFGVRMDQEHNMHKY